VKVYVVKCSSVNEDFVDFSTMTAFMNSDSWALIEKMKIPTSATLG
jgi:hypothetical protein